MTVTCGTATPTQAPVPAPFVALLAAQLLALGVRASRSKRVG